MKLMSTYGVLAPPLNQNDTFRRKSDGTTLRYKYTEVFANHYKFRHCVDDNNNLRHKVPSVEGSWYTHRWPVRVFSFIVAISEVNAFLAFRYFIWSKKMGHEMTLVQFRRKLSLQMIQNQQWKEEQAVTAMNNEDQSQRRSKRHREEEHQLCSAPSHASFFRFLMDSHCQNKVPAVHL